MQNNDDNIYGIESTDDVAYDKQGLPTGVAKYMAISEEADKENRGVVVEWEAVSGPNKGRKGKVWYLTKHENPQTSNIAKQALKRIADATGKAVTPSTPIKGRVITLDVQVQKKNPDYTEVKRYLPENHEEPASNAAPF